jgi:recombinational DNA repair protein RecR
MTIVEPCSKAEREFFAELLGKLNAAQREVAVAFTAFSLAHGVPLGSQLEAVNDQGLLVTRHE